MHGYTWLYMGVHGYIWLYMDIHDYTWVDGLNMGIHGYTCVYMGMHGYTWLYMSIHGYTWPYMAIYGCIDSILSVSQSCQDPLSVYYNYCTYPISFFGHVVRAGGMEGAVMLGIMNGPRQRWLDTLKRYSSGETISNMSQDARDGAGWRGAATAVARGRMRLRGTS